MLPMHKNHDYHFHALLHAADLVEEQLGKQLAGMNMRPKQARVLAALERLGSVPQVALAREINVTAGSMSSMVGRLENLGWLSRERDPDERRSDVLSLTKAGRSRLTGIHKAWRAMDGLIEQQLGPEKARLLSELNEELRTSLGGRVPGDSQE